MMQLLVWVLVQMKTIEVTNLQARERDVHVEMMTMMIIVNASVAVAVARRSADIIVIDLGIVDVVPHLRHLSISSVIMT